MLNESQLEKNIDWLITNASPPVIYLTHLNLLQEDPDTQKMQELWDNVQSSPSTCEIFGKQREDGSWYDGGSWAYKPTYMPKSGYTPVSPKYVTTVWLLAKLGEMGYTSEDPRIRKACEWVINWQWPNGVLSEIEVDGVFVEIGRIPNTKVAEKCGVELNNDGYIIVDGCQKTNIEGVFAAGDVTISPYRQIGTAIGDAIIAALEAFGYIKRPYYKKED